MARERSDFHQTAEIAAHDLGLILRREPLKLVDERDRVVHAFGMRIIRSEHHIICAHDLNEPEGILFVEGVHVDASLEGGHRVLHEDTRRSLVEPAENLNEWPDPRAPVLHRDYLEVREPAG